MTKTKPTTKQSARLGAYFAAGVGASMAVTSTSEAAIITIDVGPGPGEFNIGGTNGGVSSGDFITFLGFPSFGEGDLQLFNNYISESDRILVGLAGAFNYPSALQFAGGANFSYATPTKFALNQSIDGSTFFSYIGGGSVFQYTSKNGTYTSPDFGAGSYMGFRTVSGNYGWLEVTWDSAAGEFEIISGAYEDISGKAILAGQGAAPIPEPGTWAAMAVLAGGAAFARWRKRRGESLEKAA